LVMRSVVGMLFERDKVKKVVRIGKGEAKGKRRRQVKDKLKKRHAKGEVMESMDEMESKEVGMVVDQSRGRKKRKV
jgi:hypothetical protein